MWVKTALVLTLLLASTGFSASVEVFTSPENSLAAVSSFLEGANNLKIASYTFTSPEIASSLIQMAEKGADIAILLEAKPAGGFVGEELLCELQNNGIEIMLYDGAFRFMHAKYMIKETDIGKAVLVSTENFGTSGFPADREGNRGWGVVIKDEETANQFTDLFDDDMLESTPFVCDINYTFNYGSFDYNYYPILYANQDVEAIFAPDAVNPVLELIESAQSFLYIEQFYVYRYWGSKSQGYTDNLFLEAAIDKARQGVEVKILLDSYWYNVEKDDPTSNYYTAEYVNNVSRTEGLNLEARLADLSDYEKFHTKGMVIDNSVLISSINWNENSPRNNREVGVVVSGNAAEYFADIFMQDWSFEKQAEDNTIFLVIIAAIVIVLIVLILWRKLA